MSGKALPYYMVSRPALTGYVEPGLGKGTLTFYVDASDPLGAGKMVFTLTAADPWNTTGWQPFAWDLLPPVGERTYPVIRLILARSVYLETKIIKGYKRDAPKNLGIVLGPRSPFVLIFRPQDDSLIPQPGEPIQQSQFLAEPFLAGPGATLNPIAERFGLTAADVMSVSTSFEVLQTVNVTSRPIGVDIRNVRDLYRVTFGIDARKNHLPAAYAYELTAPDKPNDLRPVRLRIVHTDNIYVDAAATEDGEHFIQVEAARVSSLAQVPPQGTSLDSFSFKPVKIKVNRRRPGWIFVFELAIGLIPYVGTIYFLAEFAYAACTGKDFWGYEMTGTDLLILGVAAVLPLALPKPAVGALRQELKASPLARVLDEGITTEVQRVVEREFLEAVGSIDAKSASQLGRLLTEFASGKVGAAEILKRFNDAVGDAYLRALDRRAIERLMTADFQTFKNPQLASGFNRFAVKLGKRGATRTADPIDWVLRQTNRTRFAREMERELGSHWRDILRRSRNDVRLKPMSSTELAHYDRLAGRVEDYKSLAKLNRQHGELFEVDHILEQRFWRNDPRVASAFDEKGEGMAMLVPRDPAIAAKMPGKTIAYVHTTKTKMLADLLPHGREAEFSVQQIWDAHVFVLEALKVDRSVTFGERVVSNFNMLARARGEKLDIRIPTGTVFSPENKWPVLVGSSFF